ncbi:glutathione S-transferase family protein [Methylomarinum vadi]|uniref:glutathione S-transferase family protein n=1 Tax=Methylomarinum vadi TaxID=438855 RepID=UPI00068B7B61|nr:glutathione S-transferase family protein [Methylomarinum vadi]
MIKLYQFRFSHYCEKVRWALDYKNIPYTPVNLLPGLHARVTRKLAAQTSLPIITDGTTVVQDSSKIITYLDQKYPAHALTPEEAKEAETALAWEKYFDQEIGVPLRLWFYYHTLPDRDRTLRFMLNGAPWIGRLLFPFIFPRVRTAMKKLMGINAKSAKQAETRFLAALDELDHALQARRFLVGDQFSRADLTACALLSPYCAPGLSTEDASVTFSSKVFKLREQHSSRIFFEWVQENYKTYRHPQRKGN